MPAEPKRPQNSSSASRAEMAASSLRQVRMGPEEFSRLQAAAQANDSAAQRELGLACFRGLGVRRDLAMAFKWLTLAAEGGDAMAGAHLELLLPGLSGEDIAEGRRLIARAKGQPEPEFGFDDAESNALEITDSRATPAGDFGGEFSPWQPAETDSEAPAQALASISPASERFQSPDTSDRKQSPLTAAPLPPPTVETPATPLPRSRGVSRSLVFGIWLIAGTVCALVVVLLIVVGHSGPPATVAANPTTPAELSANLSSVPVAANPVAPIESGADVKKSPATATELDLTTLSRTLPLSLQQIKVAPKTMSRWQRLDELRGLAEKGDREAQFDLALWHLLQAKTTDDFVAAVKFFTLAAEAGYVPAQNNLGVCYVSGSGVKQDYVEGYKWFALASSGGMKSATGNRNRAAEFLTAEQLASASGRIAEYLHEGSKAPPPAAPMPNQPFSKIVPPRGYP